MAILQSPSPCLAGSSWRLFRILRTLKVYLVIPGGTAARVVVVALTGGSE